MPENQSMGQQIAELSNHLREDSELKNYNPTQRDRGARVAILAIDELGRDASTRDLVHLAETKYENLYNDSGRRHRERRLRRRRMRDDRSSTEIEQLKYDMSPLIMLVLKIVIRLALKYYFGIPLKEKGECCDDREKTTLRETDQR